MDLAAALGARLVAVSLVDGIPAHADAGRAVQRRLQSLGRELGINVEVRTLHGHSNDELVQQARGVAADLVVFAGTLERPSHVGETVEQVLSLAHIPVLVVPPES
jgi:nucleotide-binding universal stress UspA family protein